jgi:hypothetical protein
MLSSVTHRESPRRLWHGGRRAAGSPPHHDQRWIVADFALTRHELLLLGDIGEPDGRTAAGLAQAHIIS